MHKFLIMGIPSKELNGHFDQEIVCSYIEKVLGKYVDEKCDYFQIGGRWQGVLGAKKENKNVLLTENGCFEENYDFFKVYNVLENNGNNGPFVIDGTEYIPVNGGLVKEIEWDIIQKFDSYRKYTIPQHMLARDPRVGTIPDNCKFKDGDLYVDFPDGTSVLVAKKGESFADYVKRCELSFARDFIPPHAYVDLNGVWHDDNEIWEEIEKAVLKGEDMPSNVEDYAFGKFRERTHAFLDTLQPEDGVVIVDFHI